MKRIKQFFRGFKMGMGAFGYNLSVIINTILLSIVYVIGVGLTSVIAKIIGKRFMEMKVLRTVDTYWSDLNLKKKPIDEYYRQF